MKWFNKRQRDKKIEDLLNTARSIEKAQVHQWVDQIGLSVEGIRELGVIETERDAITQRTFFAIYDEARYNLDEYVNRYRQMTQGNVNEYDEDYEDEYIETTCEESQSALTIPEIDPKKLFGSKKGYTMGPFFKHDGNSNVAL